MVSFLKFGHFSNLQCYSYDNFPKSDVFEIFVVEIGMTK
ncbi:LOW QUALITY PROTEIN: hypothetical protein PanWU01x14_365430 [Parasponia andersonii]|uniref:Uncharacterized protein n=1 Tax=Parasponia andersonii TaxID=3476 RepID=A0A2P5A5Z3_PARAD|nr:LOW QUALITY PROTEIN: hypothetical protein PanWU01x14_365430 [Parasponia andersonii]